MKNNFLLGLAIAATVLTSCGDEDVAGVTINDNSVVNNNNGNTGGGEPTTGKEIDIAGNYTKDLKLEAKNTYNLIGGLVMQSGTTLMIEPGTVIKAQKGPGVYIAIAQGAKIDAQGTASKPIVMTSASSSPKAGDWGGLILLGKAPVNHVANLASGTATSEIASLPYGGNVAADNSGTVKYVRVEYSGGKVDSSTENNGFSFYGVGNGTTVEYIQMFEGLDDGVEFYGGTVNASYVSIVNSQDDSIDCTQGWTGTINNAYIKVSADSDHAFEFDGADEKIGNVSSNPKFWSKPTIKNVTIVGLGSDKGQEAVRLRRGVQGLFENVVMTGFKEGFDIDGNDTNNPTATHVVKDELNAKNIKFNDVTTKVKKEKDVTYTDADFVTEGAATGTDYATWGANWTKK